MTTTASITPQLKPSFYRFAATVPAIAAVEQQAIDLGRQQMADRRGVANDLHLFYNSTAQYWVSRYARDYTLQLGGAAKAVRDDHSRHYLDNDLAARIRAAVKDTLDGQLDEMTGTVDGLLGRS